jgi:membrane-associated protease RseP (regulator of RpoE activity)
VSEETPTGDATQPPAAPPEPAPEATAPAPPPAATEPEPTEPTPEATASAPAPAAAAAPVAVAAPAEPQKTSKSVAVPMWLLVSIAALIGAVVMFGVGYAVGESGNDDSNTAIGTPFPGSNPFDDQRGNGGGGPQQAPSRPNPPNQQTPNQGGNGNQQAPNQQGSGAFLGVATQPTDGGLEVTQVVSGSAAADAGIQVGDVITSFDGTRVSTSAQLAIAVGNLDPGDDARITYTRDGQTRTVTAELGTRPSTNRN